MRTAIVLLAVVIASACIQNGASAPGTSFSLYEGNFSLQYPSGWAHNITSADNFFTGGGEFPPTMRVSEFGGTIEEAAERSKTLQSRLKDYKIMAEESLTINGRNAFRRVYSWTDAAHNISFTQVQTWTENYLLTATSLTGDYVRYESVFMRMIESFKVK